MSAPSAYQRFLGQTFVRRYDEPVLMIGPVQLSRYDLAHALDCAATAKAAGILSSALQQLGITNVKDALALNPVDLAGIPGVGVTAIYVFLCWQREQRGSDKAVATWYGEGVTVSTLKTRVAKRKARERPPSRNGARSRRGKLRLAKSA